MAKQKMDEATLAELRTRVDEIMFYKWDPLRFSNSNLPRDEYSMYVDRVFELALVSDSPKPITEEFDRIASLSMGVSVPEGRSAKAAALIYTIIHDIGHYPDHEVITID